MSRFAEGTSVPVEKTRAELDGLLARHGATQRASYEDDETGQAAVQFRIAGRMVRLEINRPTLASVTPDWTDREKRPHNSYGWSPAKRHEWCVRRAEQGAREAWRRLLLVVKAKLELVADGGSTVEREFLADILLPDGRTVHRALAEQLENSYQTGGMPRLLGTGEPDEPKKGRKW